VKQALLLMESNLGDKIGGPEIARILNLSRRQLERLFLNEIGIGPMAAYLMLRLRYAHSLLQATDLPITEICYRCGFSNPGHFGRVFKKQFGMTPSKLRSCGSRCPPESSEGYASSRPPARP
jgi:transcriptional regulator GlxA family with amidase domain